MSLHEFISFFSLSPWALLNLNHFPQNESERRVYCTLWYNTNICRCLWLVFIFWIHPKKFLYYLYLRRNSLGNQESSHTLMKVGLFTPQKPRLNWSSPKLTLSNYGFSFFCSQIILVDILDKKVESQKEFLIRHLKRFLAN